MTGAGFWRKGASLGIVFLVVFLATATSARTTVAGYSHYTYDPDSARLTVIAGDLAGDSFDLTIGLSFTPDPGWWVDTQMIVIPSANPFTFNFEPSSFTLDQATPSQVVHVTVIAPAGTVAGSRTIKAKQVSTSGPQGVGRAAGCTVSITVSEVPTPKPTPTTTPIPKPPPPRQGACFIATAAYGTSTVVELDTLRGFRDDVLLQNSLGSQLVAVYYEISPPLADFISEHEVFRTLVREFLVDPIVWLVEATEPLWGN